MADHHKGFKGYFSREHYLAAVGDLAPAQVLTVHPRGDLSLKDAALAVRKQWGGDYEVWTHGTALHIHRIPRP